MESEKSLRARLVSLSLEWQVRFGVAPAITSAIAEYDAAKLVGHSDESFGLDCARRTSVTKGFDFTFENRRYQIKANRPSGRPGSMVTLVGKASNYDWDCLIWMLYDKSYELQEAWVWTAEVYRQEFDAKKRIAPSDMRRGRALFKKHG